MQDIRKYVKKYQAKCVVQIRTSWVNHQSWWFGALFLILMLFIYIVWPSAQIPNKTKPLPVVVSEVQIKDVPIFINALGTVTPMYTVTLQSQINGFLVSVLFKEGDQVKKGQLLAQIDPRPYQALLTQYEGNLKRDTALLSNAKIDLQRYQKLWKEDSVSQQVLATQQALVQQYEGTIESDLGLIQSTKINLLYCNITAPLDGRIGLRLIDPGNYVQTSNTGGIAQISTIDPLTVIFPVAEDVIPSILEHMDAHTLSIAIYDRQMNRVLAHGTLLALNNQIDPTTGTLKLRATVNNNQHHLFPNQFVNVKLKVQTLSKATVIPTSAIQYSSATHYVYVLQQDNTVKTQAIQTGVLYNEYTVVTGLKAGQKIVIEGADKLLDHSSVQVSQQASAKKTTPTRSLP